MSGFTDAHGLGLPWANVFDLQEEFSRHFTPGRRQSRRVIGPIRNMAQAKARVGFYKDELPSQVDIRIVACF